MSVLSDDQHPPASRTLHRGAIEEPEKVPSELMVGDRRLYWAFRRGWMHSEVTDTTRLFGNADDVDAERHS